MTKEALKLALVALEEINQLSIGENAVCLPAEIDTAMDAIKEALAQPEQEPVGWLDSNDKLAEFMHKDLKAEHDKRDSSTPRAFQIPVYTTPPQRTWVGLTDKEAFQICVDCGCLSADWLTLLDAIEAKLKERNA